MLFFKIAVFKTFEERARLPGTHIRNWSSVVVFERAIVVCVVGFRTPMVASRYVQSSSKKQTKKEKPYKDLLTAAWYLHFV